MSTEDSTYRTGEAYPATGPCSMASPCPGPDAPRDQHGAGCPRNATATLMQHDAAPDALAPEALAELRRLLEGIGYDGSEPLREWMMGHVAGRTHSRLVDAAVNLLPALLDATAERDALAAKVEDLECVLAGAGVCVECYANGWHKLDCSRRRAADALDGADR